jgi:hypothetical protein
MNTTALRCTALLFGLALVACAAETTTSTSPSSRKSTQSAAESEDEDAPATTPSKSTNPPTNSTPAPSTPSTPAPTAVDDSKCAAETSGQACATCCDAAYPAEAAFDKKWLGCVCAGTCASQCGATAACGGEGEVSEACGQCLQTAGESQSEACNADAPPANIEAYFACFTKSGCDTKQ